MLKALNSPDACMLAFNPLLVVRHRPSSRDWQRRQEVTYQCMLAKVAGRLIQSWRMDHGDRCSLGGIHKWCPHKFAIFITSFLLICLHFIWPEFQGHYKGRIYRVWNSRNLSFCIFWSLPQCRHHLWMVPYLDRQDASLECITRRTLVIIVFPEPLPWLAAKADNFINNSGSAPWR